MNFAMSSARISAATAALTELVCGVNIDAHLLTLHEEVGSGLTAEVFKGLYKGDVVAVKRFKDLGAIRDKCVQREIKALLRAKHPNVVRLWGICECPQGLQLVSEFCQGGTLFDLLHDSDVDIVYTQQAKMALDVALGMRYLHQQSPPILHRDLKSLNLLLKRPVNGPDDIPVVKVADFGLSRMVEAESGGDGTMTVCVGTVQWMAPECMSSRSYDLAVDVFSYGVCLFEIMAREPPHDELDERADVVRHVARGGRPDLGAVPADTPQLILNLMQRCWAADRGLRPTFRQVCEQLAPAQHQSAHSAVTKCVSLPHRATHAHEPFFSRSGGSGGERSAATPESGRGEREPPVTSRHTCPGKIASERLRAPLLIHL